MNALAQMGSGRVGKMGVNYKCAHKIFIYSRAINCTLLAENRKGDKYFYKITDPYLTGPKPEGEGLLNTPKSANNIIQPLQNNLNPSQPSIQKPLSHNDWLEELRRKRKKGWW